MIFCEVVTADPWRMVRRSSGCKTALTSFSSRAFRFTRKGYGPFLLWQGKKRMGAHCPAINIAVIPHLKGTPLWGNRDQNSVSWLVSAMPAKAPSALSCSMWVLESLLQHRANSSMETNSFPLRFSTVSMAAASPRP